MVTTATHLKVCIPCDSPFSLMLFACLLNCLFLWANILHTHKLLDLVGQGTIPQASHTSFIPIKGAALAAETHWCSWLRAHLQRELLSTLREIWGHRVSSTSFWTSWSSAGRQDIAYCLPLLLWFLDYTNTTNLKLNIMVCYLKVVWMAYSLYNCY